MPKGKKYRYEPLIPRLQSVQIQEECVKALDSPDRRDGLIYDFDDELHLAVEVALATGRPLLLRGDPGSGKSSFAAFVARNLDWRYYEHTVTGYTKPQDFLWRFDQVKRLSDAQMRARLTERLPLNDLDYVEPGVLWWVFNPNSARQRGFLEMSSAGREGIRRAAALAQDPNWEVNSTRKGEGAVILIDELDKADPEVPNALLIPLSTNKFRISDLDVEVTWGPREGGDSGASKEAAHQRTTEMSRLLVVVTTNEERQLPPAFLRRCIVYHLPHHDPQRLVQIAKLHFERNRQPLSSEAEEICRKIAERVAKLRKEMIAEGQRAPSTAEYLDALRACLALKIKISEAGDSEWELVERVGLLKPEVGKEDVEPDEG